MPDLTYEVAKMSGLLMQSVIFILLHFYFAPFLLVCSSVYLVILFLFIPSFCPFYLLFMNMQIMLIINDEFTNLINEREIHLK